MRDEKRIVMDITQGPDGWIRVNEGFFPVYGVSGRMRVLFRVSEESEGIRIIENQMGGVLTLHHPFLVFAGQQCKFEDIDTAL